METRLRYMYDFWYEDGQLQETPLLQNAVLRSFRPCAGDGDLDHEKEAELRTTRVTKASLSEAIPACSRRSLAGDAMDLMFRVQDQGMRRGPRTAYTDCRIYDNVSRWYLMDLC